MSSHEQRPHDWYRDARVRVGAPPGLDDASGLAFAPELLPHLSHPCLAALDERSRITLLDRALARYLHGTSVLEVRVVNDTAVELAHGKTFEVSPRERVEALQLYCDEGYHAMVASDLLAALGVDEGTLDTPPFLDALEAIVAMRARTNEDARTLRFLFTVVTETSISQSLASLSRSRAVRPAIQRYVADHARDEARHASYFTRLFRGFWGRRTDDEQTRLAAHLPALVHAFLAPAFGAIEQDLVSIGLDAALRTRVIEESRGALWASARAGARPVLACFARVGLDVAFTKEGS